MKQRFDLISLGESLIDFTPAGENELGMQLFSRNPGGAPANVLAMYAKLGGKTAFLGKVGQDTFGDFLVQSMRDAGIDTSFVCRDREVPTTLAFVQLDAHGDRSFSFYRKPGADIRLEAAEAPAQVLRQSRVFHFGSVSLTDEPCRTATLEAAKAARAAGALVSYDPNYRPFLWPEEARARDELRAAVSLSDIIKVSEEEMELLTKETNLVAGAAALRALGPVAAVVTLGPRGAFYSAACGSELLPTCPLTAVDTTGAGDAFWGAMLWQLTQKLGCASRAELAALTPEQWHAAVRFANAAGSLTTTRKGAIPALPDAAAIEKTLEQFA